MNWPLPSAIIGAIRTRCGRSFGFDEPMVAKLKAIEHVGPFLALRRGSGWELAFHAPADAVLSRDSVGRMALDALRPREPGLNEGTNAPAGILPLFGGKATKPHSGPAFWNAESTLAWLAGGEVNADDPGPRFLDWNSVLAATPDEHVVGATNLPRQRRTHVQIDPETLAAKDGQLFATEGLEFNWMSRDGEPQTGAICSLIRSGHAWPALDGLAPLGGERRGAYWSEPEIQWPLPPAGLASTTLLRLQLVTPAAFDQGWKPGWLGADNRGCPPGMPEWELELVSAAVPRFVAHSGWDMTKPWGQAQKPTRFLVPAGSVYFFKTVRPVDARRLWLSAISDSQQDRLDGFGVVLCGGWQWQSE
jgi:CRISPR-associated protein Cmr3